MGKYFVTGATGFLGEHLVKRLIKAGNEVIVLARNPNAVQNLPKEITLYKGDIGSVEHLKKGMDGVEKVFHMAALAKPWDKDKTAFHKINIEGTENVLKAAQAIGAQKVVLTSTAGVLGYSVNGEQIDEQRAYDFPLATDYEKTKRESELLAKSFASENFQVSIVNPTRVYGPGVLSQSNSTTKMIVQFSKGKWRIVPGNGEGVGNYVFVEDVVEGHILAMEKGRNGERYILGGENASFNELFAELRLQTGQTQQLFNLPLGLMLGVSGTMQFMADSFGVKPLITPPFIRKYSQKAFLSTQKAEQELGYKPLNLKEGIAKTLAWAKQSL
jgi:nucleoside-diphosphate-sugar epimerase